MSFDREQQTFEHAVSSRASIVKPTLPSNVLGEFQHFAKTGARYSKSNPFDDQEPQPADEPSAIEEPQRQVPPNVTRRAAPAPPQVAQAPMLTPQEPASALQTTPNAPPQDTQERNKLVSTMQEYLRAKAAQGEALTIGELSGQIREFTGQSWGGHWEAKYGNLLSFIKANPEAFSILKAKFVTCKGDESVAEQRLEQETAEENMRLQEQQRQQVARAAIPMNANYQPQSQTYFPDAMNSSSFYGTAPAQPEYNAFMPSPQADYNSFMAPPPDPFAYNQYPPPPPQHYNPYTPFEPSVAVLAPALAPSPYDSVSSRRDSADWALPNDTSNLFDPFNVSQASQSDDWWKMTQQSTLPSQSQTYDDDPFNMSAFEASLSASAIMPPSQSSANAANTANTANTTNAEEAKQRLAKQQEEEDAKMAKLLQMKEFNDAHPPSRSESGQDKIVLTTTQMRDLAEKELGIDNVRIIAGFTIKKYGREGRPHQRKMWVTQSLTHLAWASSLLEGHRGIELKQVTDVTSGQMTPTITRNTSDRNKVKAQCFSLVTQSRTLDMQACSVIQRDALVRALKAVVDFNHKYRPEKVDQNLTRVVATGAALSFHQDE